ncbi:hypothetical protein, partial [Nocardia sp. NPDC058497]|uniref:hypothetical protein n=1 Tax=Nocardia sp. NPDC058497 TaxID=3346529 RepID=UPI00365474AF
MPDDPEISERRSALAAKAEREIRLRNGEAEQRLHAVASNERTSAHFAAVRQAYMVAATFARRQHQCELVVADSRIKARELSRSTVFMRRRADYLQRAAEVHAHLHPELWDVVLRVVLSHQRSCPEVRSSFPCADCAPQLAQDIKVQRTKHVEPQATSVAEAAEPDNKQTSDIADTGEAQPERSGSTRADALLVAVSASTTARSSTAGLAWVTEDGQVGVAIDQAPTNIEASLIAIGRAVADLPDDLQLDVVIRNRQVRDRARWRLQRPRPVQPVAGHESSDAHDLLSQLWGQSPRVQIVNERATNAEQLAQAAAELSKVALAAVRGGRNARELRKEIDTVAARFGVEERKPLLPPNTQTHYAAVSRSNNGEF